MRQSVAGDRLSRSSTSALERMRGGGSGGFGDDNGSERAECGWRRFGRSTRRRRIPERTGRVRRLVDALRLRSVDGRDRRRTPSSSARIEPLAVAAGDRSWGLRPKHPLKGRQGFRGGTESVESSDPTDCALEADQRDYRWCRAAAGPRKPQSRPLSSSPRSTVAWSLRYNQRPVSIRAQLLAASVAESGLSDRQLSVLATGSTDRLTSIDTIRNLRRGAAPRADTLEALCRVLGLSLRLAPGEDESRTRAQGAPSQSDDLTENALARRPLSRFSDTVTLPVRHLADDSPDCEVRREESKRAAAPEDLTDEQAFYVRIAGKSMLPSDIWPNDYCLVSPCERFEAGKAVWLRHRTGAETIKWLLRLPADAYDLGAWKPPDELAGLRGVAGGVEAGGGSGRPDGRAGLLRTDRGEVDSVTRSRSRSRGRVPTLHQKTVASC